jgi:hypothetical protein
MVYSLCCLEVLIITLIELPASVQAVPKPASFPEHPTKFFAQSLTSNMPLLDIVSLVMQPLSQFQQRIANRDLCPQCRVILRGFEAAHGSDSTISIQHLPIPFKSIEGSAIKGYPLCLLFLDGMSSNDKTMLREQDKSQRQMSGSAVVADCNKWQIMLTENPSILLYRSPQPLDPSGRFIFKRIHLVSSKGG